MKKERLVFMGTPDICLPSLKQLLKTQQLVGIVTQPDKPQGRGQKQRFSPVKQLALDHQIPIAQPNTKDAIKDALDAFHPTLIIVFAYGRILPKSVTDQYICLNLHASLLPAYRGASPIQAALLNNDTQTGITLMRMNERMDEGNIITQQHCDITQTDNLESLHDKLADCSANMCTQLLSQPIARTALEGLPQDHQQASYCKKLQSEDMALSLDESAITWLAKIRAFSPRPGAYLIQQGKRIKILEAEIKDNKIHLKTVKPEGKPSMSYHDYCLGHPEGITTC